MTINVKSNYKDFSPFSRWIRGNNMLDSISNRLNISDVDYVLYKYDEDGIAKVKIIEEKCFGAEVPFSQMANHKVMDAAFKLADGKIIQTVNGKKVLKYYGYHVVVFEATSPDDGEIYLDGYQINKKNLTRFLNFKKWHYIDYGKVKPI